MVGLDIGTKTIKIVELEKDGLSFSLSASGIVGFSGNSVEKMIDEKEIRKNFDVRKCKIDHLVIDKKENRLIVTYILQGSKEELLPVPSNLYNKPWFDSMRIN